MWLGIVSLVAANPPVQVSTQLDGNIVSVSGIVQPDEVNRVGVLILNKDGNLDNPDPADIIYTNEYELDQGGAFSFSAILPEADLQEYVLRIGGDNDLLYQRMLDGSELPAGPTVEGSAEPTPPATDPVSTDPVSTDPGTTESGATEPDTTGSVTTVPGDTEPGATEPGTTEPVTTEPDTTDPGATESGAADPDTTESDAGDPISTEPQESIPGETNAPAEPQVTEQVITTQPTNPSADTDAADLVQTGETPAIPFIIGVLVVVLSILVAVVILKKQEGKHHA